jgi:hypothetical protein
MFSTRRPRQQSNAGNETFASAKLRYFDRDGRLTVSPEKQVDEGYREPAGCRRLAQSRFMFDRLEVLGPLFIVPATVYVVVLVWVPFLLCPILQRQRYSIISPSYAFLGLKNVREVIESESR